MDFFRKPPREFGGSADDILDTRHDCAALTGETSI
jgi:hypothetical protein